MIIYVCQILLYTFGTFLERILGFCERCRLEPFGARELFCFCHDLYVQCGKVVTKRKRE